MKGDKDYTLPLKRKKRTPKKPKFVEPETHKLTMFRYDGRLSFVGIHGAIEIPHIILSDEDYQSMVTLINRLMRGKR